MSRALPPRSNSSPFSAPASQEAGLLPGSGELVEKRTSALVFTIASATVLFGVPFGIVALRPGLLKAGIFLDTCESGYADVFARTGVPCHKMALILAQVFALVIVLGAVGTLPFGILADRWGPRGVIRACLLVTGAGFAISGIDLHSGIAFTIGMCVASIAAIAVGAVATTNVLPDGCKEEDTEMWFTISVALADGGCVVAVPIGALIKWTILPVWVWMIVVGIIVLAIFLPLHHVAVREKTVKPPTLGHVTVAQVTRRSYVQRLFLPYLVTMAWGGAIESASGHIFQHFGGSGGSANSPLIMYVPLVVAAGAFASTIVFLVIDFDHIRVGTWIRYLSLLAVIVIMSLPKLHTPSAFWLLIFFMSSFRASTLGAVIFAGFDLAEDAAKGTVVGVLTTFSCILALIPMQLYTYVLADHPDYYAHITLGASVLCLGADIFTLQVLREGREATAAAVAPAGSDEAPHRSI